MGWDQIGFAYVAFKNLFVACGGLRGVVMPAGSHDVTAMATACCMSGGASLEGEKLWHCGHGCRDGDKCSYTCAWSQ